MNIFYLFKFSSQKSCVIKILFNTVQCECFIHDNKAVYDGNITFWLFESLVTDLKKNCSELFLYSLERVLFLLVYFYFRLTSF